MRSARHLRATTYAVAAVAVAATVIACGGSPTPSGSTAATVTDTTAVPTSAAPSSAGVDYPTDPAAYAAAVRAAWTGGDASTLDALTGGSAQSQLAAIPGATNSTWHAGACDGAAGSSYCVADNDNGDVLTIRIVNQYLGQAHAADDVQFDPTSLTDDIVAEFVAAWQSGNTWRMNQLAMAGAVSFATGHTAPPTGYQTCGDGAAGTSYTTVYVAGGPAYVIAVGNEAHAEGQPHAIVSVTATSVPTPTMPGVC